MIVLSLVLMTALQLFIQRTQTGRAMRSTAIDRDAAQIMGVNINSTIALVFFIGSALAGAAGVVQGLYFGVTVFNIGFQAGLKAFTAAVLGGIGNITGAAIGGFVIGFIEVLASIFGVGRWSEAAVFDDPRPRADLPAHRHPRPAAGGPGMTAATGRFSAANAVQRPPPVDRRSSSSSS